MIESLLGLILGAMAKAFTTWLSDKRRDAAFRDLGAAEGSVVLNKTVAEIADAQAANTAIDRGGAGDVLRELRREAAARRGSNAG